MPRIACLFTPMFPLAARLRSEPDLFHEAVVIVEGNGTSAHVVAATRRARKKGIVAGLSLTQARSILPKVIARSRDAECERTAQEALLEVAEAFSPRLEDSAQGVVYFDVTGMSAHYAGDVADEAPSPSDVAPWEMRLARAAIRAAEKVGLPARCGIGSSKLSARVAAELPQSPSVVPEGAEETFLSPLPLTRLAPELDVATMLHRWGLTSIGELARLSESEVASRLGETGRALHRAARGIDPRPLIPRALPQEFREGMDLEWPLVALEPFLFIASAALDRLARRLEIQGFSCKRLELTLSLEPDGFWSRAIDLPAPTRDVKTMLTLLRLDLEKSQPGAPVTAFALVAHPDRPRRAQLSLFGPAAISPEALATTIARLVALLGDGRVGMALPVDGFRPEAFQVSDFDPPPPPDLRQSPRKSRGLLATRVFRPPISAEVITRASHASEPGELQIESIHATAPPPPPRDSRIADRRVEMGKPLEIAGRVRISSGPWHLEDGWWTDAPVTREYWDVELEGGGIYRVYADGGGWFVDARYD
jgi:protein ImuB